MYSRLRPRRAGRKVKVCTYLPDLHLSDHRNCNNYITGITHTQNRPTHNIRPAEIYTEKSHKICCCQQATDTAARHSRRPSVPPDVPRCKRWTAMYTQPTRHQHPTTWHLPIIQVYRYDGMPCHAISSVRSISEQVRYA